MKKITLSLQQFYTEVIVAMLIAIVFFTSCGKTVDEPLDTLQQVANSVHVHDLIRPETTAVTIVVRPETTVKTTTAGKTGH